MLPKQTVLYLISPIMSDWCSLTSLWVRSTQKASNQTQISCGVVSQYTQGLVTFNDIPAILFLYITTPKSPAHRTQTPCGAFSSYISFKLNTLPSYPLHMLVPHHLDHMRFSDGHSGTPQKSADRRNKPPFVHSLFSWLLNVLDQCNVGAFSSQKSADQGLIAFSACLVVLCSKARFYLDPIMLLTLKGNQTWFYINAFNQIFYGFYTNQFCLIIGDKFLR